MHTPKEPAKHIGDFPTVMVAELEDPVRSTLLLNLRKEGIHVLDAQGWTSAFNLIRSHSRPIHLLLTNMRRARLNLAETLKPYRPELRVLFVAQYPSEILPNVLHPDAALAKIREFFKPR